MTLTQMALGFRSRWFVASTIIGASSLAQLQETLPATRHRCRRTPGEIDAIHLRTPTGALMESCLAAWPPHWQFPK
jgi:aryl-alcohol dehydrogenase-like predicted oxidoreductase